MADGDEIGEQTAKEATVGGEPSGGSGDRPSPLAGEESQSSIAADEVPEVNPPEVMISGVKPQETKSPPTSAPPSNPFGWIEKSAVYVICAIVLLVAGLALNRNMKTVDTAYGSALADIQKESESTGASAHDRFTTKVAILGMRDMISLRSAVLFVGFLALMLGCVLVLKGVEATYNLKLTDGSNEATITTASPGLVLITAGVVLVIVALKVESKVSLELEGGESHTAADAATPGAVRSGGAGCQLERSSWYLSF